MPVKMRSEGRVAGFSANGPKRLASGGGGGRFATLGGGSFALYIGGAALAFQLFVVLLAHIYLYFLNPFQLLGLS